MKIVKNISGMINIIFPVTLNNSTTASIPTPNFRGMQSTPFVYLLLCRRLINRDERFELVHSLHLIEAIAIELYLTNRKNPNHRSAQWAIKE